jgi:hypothetical protein
MASPYGSRISEWYERRVDRAIACADTIWLVANAGLLLAVQDPKSPDVLTVFADILFLVGQILAVGLYNGRRWAFSFLLIASVCVGVPSLFLLPYSAPAWWFFIPAATNAGWALYRLTVTE